MSILIPPEALRSTPPMTPLTLADICQLIARDDGLRKTRKANLRSAITCFSAYDAVDGSHHRHRNVPDTDRPRGAT